MKKAVLRMMVVASLLTGCETNLYTGKVNEESSLTKKYELTGVINNSKSAPMPGVQVEATLPDGSKLSTTTDADGSYSLPIDQKGILGVKFYGAGLITKTQRVIITRTPSIDSPTLINAIMDEVKEEVPINSTGETVIEIVSPDEAKISMNPAMDGVILDNANPLTAEGAEATEISLSPFVPSPSSTTPDNESTSLINLSYASLEGTKGTTFKKPMQWKVKAQFDDALIENMHLEYEDADGNRRPADNPVVVFKNGHYTAEINRFSKYHMVSTGIERRTSNLLSDEQTPYIRIKDNSKSHDPIQEQFYIEEFQGWDYLQALDVQLNEQIGSVYSAKITKSISNLIEREMGGKPALNKKMVGVEYTAGPYETVTFQSLKVYQIISYKVNINVNNEKRTAIIQIKRSVGSNNQIKRNSPPTHQG